MALGLHRTASNRKPSSFVGSFSGPRSGQHRSIRTPAARRQASLRMASSIMTATASSADGADSSHQNHHHGHHGLHLPGLHHHHGGQHGATSDSGVTAVISPRAAAPSNALAVVGAPFNHAASGGDAGVKLQEVKVIEGTTPPDWPATGKLSCDQGVNSVYLLQPSDICSVCSHVESYACRLSFAAGCIAHCHQGLHHPCRSLVVVPFMPRRATAALGRTIPHTAVAAVTFARRPAL